MHALLRGSVLVALLLAFAVHICAVQQASGQTGHPLTPVSGADGVFETVTLVADTVYRSAGTPGAYERYLYFRTDAEVRATTAYVEVTYLDRGYGDLGIQYNATTGDYEIAIARRGAYVQDTRGRRTAVFELPNADFRDAQNLGTDLRVFSEPGLQKHLLSATLYLEPPPSLPIESLATPAPSFGMNSHIVSSTVFHWYVSAGGQLSGPWRPVEGRENWTGQPDWWKLQVKQMMRANIDVIYVHYFPGMHQQRINLFQALSELRAEGWDVPKVAAWLDPLITWHEQPKIDLSTAAGKDELASHYIRFFEQYFSVNTDAHADDYLARIDGRPVLNTWHVHLSMDNVASLTREDLEGRLQDALAAEHPVFDNGIYMVTTALNPPFFTFADERVPQFEINDYYVEHQYGGLTTVQLKGGYWDQNIRTPGDFLARGGGVPYAGAWSRVDDTVDRVYVESWNEYDEGTGIYAADTGPPFVLSGSENPSTDVWSGSGDPFEYIKTTATGAARWNDTPAHDAKVLAHTLPATMRAGETVRATLTVRNEGDALWTGREGYRLAPANPEAERFADAVLIDDEEDGIPRFGGIFRGRPTTFAVSLTAPDAAGTYTTRWRMEQAGAGGFGEVVEVTIAVTANAAPTAQADASTTDEDTPVTIAVLDNDSDPDGDPDGLTVRLAAAPDHGTAEVLTDGRIRYVPEPDFSGEDSFRYQVQDGAGTTAEATVTVTVTAVNDAPTAATVTTPGEGAEILVGATDGGDPLGTDTAFEVAWTAAGDADGDLLTYTWHLATAEAFGQEEVLLSASTGADTRFETTLGTLAALLDEEGLTFGSSLTLHHRVLVTDGVEEIVGPAATVTFVRGRLVAAEEEGAVPAHFALEAAYPNPFNPATLIRYALPQASEVHLVVYDVLGREVTVLVDGVRHAGWHEVVWEAAGLPSGTYLYRLEAGTQVQVRQVMLLR